MAGRRAGFLRRDKGGGIGALSLLNRFSYDIDVVVASGGGGWFKGILGGLGGGGATLATGGGGAGRSGIVGVPFTEAGEDLNEASSDSESGVASEIDTVSLIEASITSGGQLADAFATMGDDVADVAGVDA